MGTCLASESRREGSYNFIARSVTVERRHFERVSVAMSCVQYVSIVEQDTTLCLMKNADEYEDD